MTTQQAEAAFNAAHELADQQRLPEAIAQFEQGLALTPAAFRERVLYARALEISGRGDAALPQYYRAVRNAQDQGRWRGDASTPEHLRDLVRYAIDYIDAGRRRLFDAVLAPLRGGGIARIDACLDVYLMERTPLYGDVHQRPTFLFVPDVPAHAFFGRDLFPWYAELEANTAAIRAELEALLGEQANFKPFLTFDSPDQVPRYLGGEKPNWDAFFFYRHGERFDDNCARCPQTTAVLEALPLVRIAEHAPEICFSVLTPDTHILPHHGSTNARLVTHLPLIVPDDCAIRVGTETHVWQEGRCITFDDTFEHEAWNRSDRTRAVLILDAWNPYLSEAERHAFTALTAAIRQFNREAGVID